MQLEHVILVVGLVIINLAISVFSFHPVKIITTAEGGAASQIIKKFLKNFQCFVPMVLQGIKINFLTKKRKMVLRTSIVGLQL